MSKPLIEGMHTEDISRQVFGKYMTCTRRWGLWYADEDFSTGVGFGRLRYGAIPAPECSDRRPWRGVLVELWRRARGAQRDDS